MKSLKKVSIITRTKNRKLLLERALQSICSQKFKDFIWVIVNDGGEKKPVDQVVRIAKSKNIDVIVIHNKVSKGMEYASNLGLKNSSSKYCVIHDDDDSWHPLFLDKTVDFLESNNEFNGVVTLTTLVKEEIIDGKINTISFSDFNKWMLSIQFSDLIRENTFPPISFLYKRECFKAIGYYNELLPVLGDWDFNLRFLAYSNIGLIYESLAFYHHRIKSKTEDGNSLYINKENHIKYDAIIRNNFIRNDIKKGKIGLGVMLLIGRLSIDQINRARRANPFYLLVRSVINIIRKVR
jgi:glycosyltransferase involved in cell wall biosynthesis